jgi:predicted protein tyrosine phosphatase
MRVDVYNREQIQSVAPGDGDVLISISAPWLHPTEEDLFPKVMDGWHDIIRPIFHDVSDVGYEHDRRIIVFNDDHADLIQEFTEKNVGRNFSVHCAAGMSRSVAIGLFLRDAHGYDMHLHAVDCEMHANKFILAKLMRKHWINCLGIENIKE